MLLLPGLSREPATLVPAKQRAIGMRVSLPVELPGIEPGSERFAECLRPRAWLVNLTSTVRGFGRVLASLFLSTLAPGCAALDPALVVDDS